MKKLFILAVLVSAATETFCAPRSTPKRPKPYSRSMPRPPKPVKRKLISAVPARPMSRTKAMPTIVSKQR